MRTSRFGPSCRPLQCEKLEPRHLLSGVTLITHGFNGNVDGWVTEMADAVADRFGSSADQPRYEVTVTDPGHDNGPLSVAASSLGTSTPADPLDPEITILLDWSDVAGSLSWGGGYHRSTADVAASVAEVLVQSQFLPNFAAPLAELPFHLIGHSRGASLVAELAKNLGEQGVWVDQVTTLDPHPVDKVREPWLFNYDFGDPAMTARENVTFWDNYWRTDGNSSFDFTGESVANTFNVQLVESVLTGGYSNDHSNVHLWYHGTIDTSPTANDGDYTVPADWYGGSHPERDASGYFYSRIVEDNDSLVSDVRPASGLSTELGGTSNRAAVNWSAAQWPNIVEVDVSASDLQFDVGEPISVTYYYQEPDSSAEITLSLDTDRNPYTDNNLSETAHSVTVTGASLAQDTTAISSNAPAGTYYVMAMISDGNRTRYAYASDPVELTSGGNPPPLANAGDDVTVSDTDDTGGETVTLTGSGSDNGTIVGYQWSEGGTILGNQAVLLNESFGVGTHTVTLTVTDNEGATGSDTVLVTVHPNETPIANAGPDQTVGDGDTVTLNGSLSDDDGEIVAYQWKEGTTVLSTSASFSQVFPIGSHTITLSVTDNGGATDSDTMVVTVTANQPPTADAGQDQTVGDPDGSHDQTVTLNGTGSNDDGTIVAYEWKEGTTVLGNSATITPLLTVGTHTITLTVEDDDGATDSDTVIVTVNPNQNPTADAGNDMAVTDSDGNGSQAVSLTGGGSDTDGFIESYQWTEGTTVLGNTKDISPTLTVGEHTLTLTVTDNGGASASDTVVVQVKQPSSATPLYVYDIRFESAWSGILRRAVFEIRSDSNGDGQGSIADDVAAGVEITVEFNGRSYTGTTDSNGIFRTSWNWAPPSGTRAEVVDLALDGFSWDPLAIDLEGDSDGDGLPDAVL